MIPCKDCITLAICRAYYFNYPDNSISRMMKARFTINKCEPATRYVYIHPENFVDAEGREKSLRTMDKNRIREIYEYFDNPYNERK